MQKQKIRRKTPIPYFYSFFCNFFLSMQHSWWRKRQDLLMQQSVQMLQFSKSCMGPIASLRFEERLHLFFLKWNPWQIKSKKFICCCRNLAICFAMSLIFATDYFPYSLLCVAWFCLAPDVLVKKNSWFVKFILRLASFTKLCLLSQRNFVIREIRITIWEIQFARCEKCKWVENRQFVKFCCSFCGRRAPQSARILLSNSWFICDWYCSLFLAFNPAESKISGHQAFAELAKTCFYVDTKCDFQTWPLLISLHWCKPSETHESFALWRCFCSRKENRKRSSTASTWEITQLVIILNYSY